LVVEVERNHRENALMTTAHTSLDAVSEARATTSLARLSLTGVSSAYWYLRLGAAACFIGHGAFGFITKAAWLPYFGVVGIPETWAWRLMPVVGAFDVLTGMAVLFAPRAGVLLYMSLWAIWTALLRPLSGDSLFEFIERAGNYGVPFALLLLTAWPLSLHRLLARSDGPSIDVSGSLKVERVLKWTTVLVLAGHGALGALTDKALLTSHYAAIGLGADTTGIVGWFELVLAACVAVRPAVGLLLFVATWKAVTESLFVAAGAPIWELVERMGSIVAPLALAALCHRPSLVYCTQGFRKTIASPPQ
jgi:hypothetical protein